MASIIFAILIAVPVALFQYFPENEAMLGFIAGLCSLMLSSLTLSPVTQKIRGKERYSFPFAPMFIILLMGTPVFVLYGWQAVYYTIAISAGLSFFGNILFRVLKKKNK